MFMLEISSKMFFVRIVHYQRKYSLFGYVNNLANNVFYDAVVIQFD